MGRPKGEMLTRAATNGVRSRYSGVRPVIILSASWLTLIVRVSVRMAKIVLFNHGAVRRSLTKLCIIVVAITHTASVSGQRGSSVI